MESYTYGREYISLPITIDSAKFPGSIVVDGKALQIKKSFHISLVCVKEVAQFMSEEKLEQLFREYVTEHPIAFIRFTNEFRNAKRDEDETVVVRCDVSNLEGFFERLRLESKVSIPSQPTHVTLYTLVPGRGIGITSETAMQQFSREDFPELFEVLSSNV